MFFFVFLPDRGNLILCLFAGPGMEQSWEMISDHFGGCTGETAVDGGRPTNHDNHQG